MPTTAAERARANPPAGPAPASSVPPSTDTRSRMPTNPWPPFAAHADRHRRRRRTRSTRRRETDSATSVAHGPACFRTFVSASCTTRYAVNPATASTGAHHRTRQPDVHARAPHRLHQVVDRFQSGLRCEVVFRPQDAEQPAQFDERTSSGVGDALHRLPGACGVGVQHGLGGFGLHRDDAHVVRDDVVQVACDRETLLRRGALRSPPPAASPSMRRARAGSASSRRRPRR